MLKLFILRHAKASRADYPDDDYERPLTKGGAIDAAKVGKYLKRKKLRPDLVLCSGAVRTRATLKLVLGELGEPAPEVLYDEALYHPSCPAIVEKLQNVSGTCRHLMLVGHNPELHALARDLVGQGKPKELSALIARFPTSALAVVDFDTGNWSTIRSGSGKLAGFLTP
jgi:phosphohistidine phosphatase